MRYRKWLELSALFALALLFATACSGQAAFGATLAAPSVEPSAAATAAPSGTPTLAPSATTAAQDSTTTPYSTPTRGAIIGAVTTATFRGTVTSPQYPPLTAAGLGVPVITLADGGKTVNFAVGERFLLDLGMGMQWTVAPFNPPIVTLVTTENLPAGAQGLYQTLAPGEVTLMAAGGPPCLRSHPPCMMPSIAFQVRLVIH